MARTLCKTRTGRVRAHLKSGRCPVGTHAQRVRGSRQTGSSSYRADKRRKAKRPGMRWSASGHRYYERRRNRSDKSRRARV